MNQLTLPGPRRTSSNRVKHRHCSRALYSARMHHCWAVNASSAVFVPPPQQKDLEIVVVDTYRQHRIYDTVLSIHVVRGPSLVSMFLCEILLFKKNKKSSIKFIESQTWACCTKSQKLRGSIRSPLQDRTAYLDTDRQRTPTQLRVERPASYLNACQFLSEARFLCI